MFSFDSSTFFLNLYVTFSADPCYYHQNLSDASRKSSYVTPDLQQRVCRDRDVVQSTQAGWMVLILQWKMVKFAERCALVIAMLVANTQRRFLWKTVDPTSSTNFFHLLVPHVTVEQSECEAKNSTNKRTYKLILRYTYFRDLAKSFLW